ncbi:MAG: DUF1501 domain-containing protein [Pirellulaceae bacterium]
MPDIASQRPHDARINRRRLLRAGTAGLFGLSLPRLLFAESQSGGATEKACIFVILSGGLSHIDTWDPKPDAPEEIRGPYRPIATRTPGMQLTDRFPKLAEVSPHFCLARCLSHEEIPHVTAAHMMLTGQTDGSRQNDSPLIGSLISKLRPSSSVMPSHVWLHNMKTGTNKIPRYDSGLSVVGYEHAALHVGHELDNPSDPAFRVKAFDPAEGLSLEQLGQRWNLLDQLRNPAGAASQSVAEQRFQRFQQRARDLVNGPAARQAFDLSREPNKVRDRYGRHPLGQYLLMARRLIEAGARLTTVTGWPGLAPGETQPTITQVWDMHGIRYKAGDTMYGNGPFGMQWSLPRLDEALSALIADLADRGLLDNTLVVVASEFGRTPKFENDNRGRGHWPNCYTCLLAGGGVRGGMVYGSSDRQGAFPASGRPIGFEDFGATIYHALGIPPELRYGPDGFSFRVSNGRPVQELFA